jgi:hypothetical protein
MRAPPEVGVAAVISALNKAGRTDGTSTSLALTALGCREDPRAPAGAGGPSLAAATSTQQLVNHIAITRFVPCANGGVGEDVFLSGDIHIVVHVTLDGRGGAHFDEIHNPQGVSGVGLTTGTMCRGVGESPFDASDVRVGEEHTSVSNILIIGQGRHPRAAPRSDPS